jgi:homeobox protein cut-like
LYPSHPILSETMIPADNDDDEVNAFQLALSKWREIDLASLQPTLDKQAVEIVETQKDFLMERKELSTKTKLFRKLPDDEKLLQVMSLLKGNELRDRELSLAYQGMIDALTNRSKTAETAFVSIYKLLAEAPDPYPILEATVAELVDAEEATRLAEENARLRLQVDKQGDINQLKIQLRQRETQTEELVKERVVQKEKEMMALIDEKERNWSEREQDYQRQIVESREMMKELRVTQEAASARLSAQDEKFGMFAYYNAKSR